MAHRFGTPEWAAALAERVNASAAYRAAAAGWGKGFNGNVLLAFEADAVVPVARHLLLRLAEGRCDGCDFVDDPGHPDAAFVLRAPYGVWIEILHDRTSAASAVLSGRMEVEGDTFALLRFASAHRLLMACAGAVETDFDAAG